MIEPDRWTIAFHRTSPYWWVRLLALGKFKHVSAFAWVRDYGIWVYYDITLMGTKLLLLPDSADATAWIAAQTATADLVQMQRRPLTRPVPIIAPFCCVAAVGHLVGVSGGTLPSTLYRACLQHGGEPIDGRAGETDTQPGTVAPAGAGQG
jgi:hypothetical protein